jgi:hypothetical protein
LIAARYMIPSVFHIGISLPPFDYSNLVSTIHQVSIL